MKKISKKIAFCALILALFMFAPHTSRANFISDLVHWLKGDKDHNKDNKDRKDRDSDKDSSRNSVPIDGGVVFLVIAGLGLGAKMLYDHNKKSKTEPGFIA